VPVEEKDRIDYPRQNPCLAWWSGQDKVVVRRVRADVEDRLMPTVGLDVDGLADKGTCLEYAVIAGVRSGDLKRLFDLEGACYPRNG